MSGEINKIVKYMAIPEINEIFMFKLKELEIQFASKIENLKKTIDSKIPESPKYFEFILKRNNSGWLPSIKIPDENIDIEDILPKGFIDIITSYTPEKNRINVIDEQLFNTMRKINQRFLIRFGYQNDDEIVGSVRIMDIKSSKHLFNDVTLEFIVNALDVLEIQNLEEYVFNLIRYPFLREKALKDYHYKYKALYKKKITEHDKSNNEAISG